MDQPTEKFIDIEKLFRDKNPKALKWLPRFILRYLKRVIHEDEVNRFMKNHHDDEALGFASALVTEFGVTVEVFGLENIPATGGAILVANHPLGGFDAMALVPELVKVRKDIKYVVNDLLLHIRQLRSIFTGVNKIGKNAAESLQQVDELFASDQLICLFPAGLVSRRVKGRIQDLEWKKTFVTRAKKYKKDVIPVYIEGSLTPFFYRLSAIRKALGIKLNIEMLYLADEMYRQKGKTIRIIIGQPVSHENFTRQLSDVKWAEVIREKVYDLAAQLPQK